MNSTASRILALAAASTLVSLAWAKEPEAYFSDDFDAKVIDHITVLPVLDHRIENPEPEALNNHREMKRAIKIHVGKRRYPMTVETSLDYLNVITRDGLEDQDPKMIAALGPEHARYVLLLVFEDSAVKFGVGKTTTAEMTGYLFDKESRSVLWRHTGSFKMKSGIVTGIGSKGTALLQVTRSVMITLPKKPKE